MSARRSVFLVAVVAVVLLGSVGCSATTKPQVASADPAVTSANPLQDLVRYATVRIEADGSFREPEGVKLNSQHGGSGFVIDPAGLVVTNNHVVTGAALLKVYVQGEQEPRHAKVLGVSECSDLALLQLTGSDLTSLNWYQGEISAGLDVYAAGYPLGDPEFTLTRGIVSKARADGKSDWASVPAVVEHDAALNPGNSGGPLVTRDGEVVGINYASANASKQYYAIAQAEADKIINELRQGRDVDTIGLNGKAFITDDEEFSGIWVFSVESGSPADKAGIRPGDIVTKLEGMVLASDGTMADYCDILRTHNTGDTLNVQVLRFDTEAVFEGQINGRELKEVMQLSVEPTAAPTATSVVARAPTSTPLPIRASPTATPRTGSPMLLPITFARDVTSDDRPIGAGTEFAADVTEVWAIFNYRDLPSGTIVEYVWYEDDENVLDGTISLSGDGVHSLGIANHGDPVGSAAYRLDLSMNDRVVQRAVFRIAAAPTARPTVRPTQPPAAQGSMIVTVQSYSYEQWGRPPYMDDPDGACSPFDDSRPVKRLRVSLYIENHSRQAMNDWYGYFYKSDGTQAPTCYYTYRNGSQPAIQPGQGAEITFLVYVERNETISYGAIHDSRLGWSQRVYFSAR